jgi:excisionase family DNA binding protein
VIVAKAVPANMQPTYSTVEVARRLGVSVQTVQRWVDIGRLRAWKTLGGHRRIDAEDANALFREFAEGRAEPAAAEGATAVLVVDDNPVDRELAVLLVLAVLPSASVTEAASGFEALVAVGKRRFDALITDIAMPHMNGVEMLRHLVEEVTDRPRFLLATSSHSPSELRSLGDLPAGVTLVPKPLSEEMLKDWLTSRLGAQGAK